MTFILVLPRLEVLKVCCASKIPVYLERSIVHGGQSIQHSGIQPQGPRQTKVTSLWCSSFSSSPSLTHRQATWIPISASPYPLLHPKRLKMSLSLSHIHILKLLTYPSKLSSISVACLMASCWAGKDHMLATVLTLHSLSKPSLLYFSECIFLPLSLPKSWASCQHPFQAHVCSVALSEMDQESCSYKRYSRWGKGLTITRKWTLHTTLEKSLLFFCDFLFLSSNFQWKPECF